MMKKRVNVVVCLVAVLTVCLLMGSISVFAADKSEGMSNKEINKKLMDDMMKEVEEQGIDIYDFDEGELKLQEIAKKTGLHRNQVSMLLGKGYTEEEILTMDMEEADAILTKGMDVDELSMYYTHVAPRRSSDHEHLYLIDGECSICGYTPDPDANWTHIDATGGYHASGCFIQGCGLTASNVNTACYRAKLIAMKMYDQTSSTYLKYDYYMFGENYGEEHPGWAHEGIDMRYLDGSNAEVYSPIMGKVLRITEIEDEGTTVMIGERKYRNGTIVNGTFTLCVQHLNDVTVSLNEIVYIGTQLGVEGSEMEHTHAGVCTNKTDKCTTIHSGQNLTLNCVAPYTYLD